MIGPDVVVERVKVEIVYRTPFEGSTTIGFSFTPAPGDILTQALFDLNSRQIAQQQLAEEAGGCAPPIIAT